MDHDLKKKKRKKAESGMESKGGVRRCFLLGSNFAKNSEELDKTSFPLFHGLFTVHWVGQACTWKETIRKGVEDKLLPLLLVVPFPEKAKWKFHQLKWWWYAHRTTTAPYYTVLEERALGIFNVEVVCVVAAFAFGGNKCLFFARGKGGRGSKLRPPKVACQDF